LSAGTGRPSPEDFFGKHHHITPVLPDAWFYAFSKMDLKAAEGAQPGNSVSTTLEPESLRFSPPLWNDGRGELDKFMSALFLAYKKRPAVYLNEIRLKQQR
jgi:hypothetical protein